MIVWHSLFVRDVYICDVISPNFLSFLSVDLPNFFNDRALSIYVVNIVTFVLFVINNIFAYWLFSIT